MINILILFIFTVFKTNQNELLSIPKILWDNYMSLDKPLLKFKISQALNRKSKIQVFNFLCHISS